MASDTIQIEGDTVRALSPEGQEATMPVEAFVRRLTDPPADLARIVLPDGIKSVWMRESAMIWVHELPPQVHNFRWIAPDSPARFGNGTKYREVRLALPYLVTFAVFIPGPRGRLTLSHSNECFFRNRPLAGVEDELLYPALLNCSKFNPPEGRPLSWICTQHLDRSFDRETETPARVRGGFASLMRTLIDSAFNYSSEEHEGASWYGESRGADPRIATVEAWQTASEQDPLFALEVPWLKTGHGIRQLAERIFANLKIPAPRWPNAAALARVVFNQREPDRPRRLAALLSLLSPGSVP